MKFRDNSKIKIEGRGDIKVSWKTREILQFRSVLFVLELAANILSLNRLDEEGCRMTMAGGKLTIFNHDDQLLVEVWRFESWLYLLKLNVVDQCMVTTEDSFEH